MKKVLFTGGGTAGHVSVNLALIPEFKEKNYSIAYIGSKNGIEKEMIEKLDDVNYYPISSGKLRRYFDINNFIDPFKVIKGIVDALIVLKKEKPDFIFSKGGFVSVPVCIAAKLLNIPALLHESDMSPGLANKINIKFSNHIFTTFEETLKYLPKNKSSLIGAIIRNDLYNGSKAKGYELTGFDHQKPIILVMGGSLGSKIINEHIWNHLDKFLEKYQIIHLVGKSNINHNYLSKPNYKQFEFLNEEFFDVIQIVDVTISRAGANSIYEFLALDIPSILIPLGSNQSRGDQIENASFFEKNNFSKTILEEEIEQLNLDYLDEFYHHKSSIKESMIAYKSKKNIINSTTDFYNKILEKKEAR